MDDIRERVAVGVVDEQRDAVLPGQVAQAAELLAAEHVAGRVGRAGQAHRRDVGREMKPFKVHPVLEFVRAAGFDERPAGGELALGKGLVRVADVVGHQREQDAAAALRRVAGQQVEQQEEGVLAAWQHHQVFAADVPAAFAPEKGGEGLAEGRIARRRIVVEQHAVQGGFVRREGAQAFAPERLHLRDRRRLAAAEHAHAGIFGQGRAQVVHEFLDAARAGEALAKGGEGVHGGKDAVSAAPIP